MGLRKKATAVAGKMRLEEGALERGKWLVFSLNQEWSANVVVVIRTMCAPYALSGAVLQAFLNYIFVRFASPNASISYTESEKQSVRYPHFGRTFKDE